MKTQTFYMNTKDQNKITVCTIRCGEENLQIETTCRRNTYIKRNCNSLAWHELRKCGRRNLLEM